MSTCCPPFTRILKLTRLRVLLMLVLAVTSSSLLVWRFTLAIPAPSRNSICEPGGCTTVPCTYDVYIDTSSYLGKNCKTGVNDFKETTLQAILTDVSVNNAFTWFEPGTYSLTAAEVLNGLAGVTWRGVPGSTIFQQANSVNVANAMIRIGQGTTDMVIDGITFDFNKANNPGSPGYTCPNAGWILELDPNGGSTDDRITITESVFKNSFCQAIESLSQDLIITENNFFSDQEALFITGIQSQRVIISSNLMTGMTSNAVDIEDRSQNITIANNIMAGTGAGSGIGVIPGNFTTITGNTISSFLTGVALTGSGVKPARFITVNANVISNNANEGIKLQGASGTIDSFTMTGNTLRDNGGSLTDQAQIFSTTIIRDEVISSNIIVDTRSGASRNKYGIYLSGTNETVVNGNVIDQGQDSGIFFAGVSFFITVEGNTIENYANGIKLATPTTLGQYLILGNLVQNDTTPISISTGYTSPVWIQNNIPYNPVGKITNFVVSSTFAPWGASSTVVASTDYTINGVAMYLTSSAGTGVSITIKDGAGNTIYAPGATLSVPFFIPLGDKVNFGAFSVAPTVTVWGN